MSMEEFMKKVVSIEGIDPKDIEELKGIIEKKGNGSESDKAIKEAKATAARILEEKKKLQEKVAEHEAELEALKTGGLSEMEKVTKELERMLKSKEKLEAELNETKAKSVQTERNYMLEKISGKVKFLDTIPEALRSYAINSAFKDVQDLSQEDAVEKTLSAFKDSNKGILASDVDVRGSGSNGQQPISGKTSPEKMTDDERAKHIRSVVREKNRI